MSGPQPATVAGWGPLVQARSPFTAATIAGWGTQGADPPLLQVKDGRHLAAFAGEHVEGSRRRLGIHNLKTNIAARERKNEFSRRKHIRLTRAKNDYFRLCRQQVGKVFALQRCDGLITPAVKNFIARYRNAALIAGVTNLESVFGNAADRDRGR